MPNVQKKREQDEILLQKLLDLRDSLSPFNVIFDSLEQSAKPLLLEYIRRANKCAIETVQISFETASLFPGVKRFVRAWKGEDFSAQKVLDEITKSEKEHVVIIDSITPMLLHHQGLIQMVSGIRGTRSSLIVVCHSPIIGGNQDWSYYGPQAHHFLQYLATAVISVSSLQQHLAQIAATQESKTEPARGLEEECEGLVAGAGANFIEGVLVRIEYRRQSGRPVGLLFVLEPTSSKVGRLSKITLVQEQGLLHNETMIKDEIIEEQDGLSFSLGLSKSQRRTRANVTLPYLDAQDGEAQGGRILYDMDKNDDFDDEEDEI